MAVSRLDLTDFRNYATLRLNASPSPLVLTGPNGAGKTNLLEALSFLAPGRGLRRAPLTEVGRTGPDREPGGSWSVAARLDTAAGPVAVGTGVEPADTLTRPRRALRIDGAPVSSQSALAETVRVVWLTPAMDRLFVDGPSARLRFLDRLVCGLDPTHATRIANFNQAMRERARLLKSSVDDAAWLSALEERLAERGVAISAARRDTVARLAVAGQAPAPFPRLSLALSGELEDWLDAAPALAVEDRLRAALASTRRRDAERGRASHGPQRSDLDVRHVDKNAPAARCSTGEQKALLIAVVLAYARLQGLASGATPLLLLDEIAAHLDAQRRQALFDDICNLRAQAWLTGTDPALFEPLRGRAQFLQVADAGVTLESEG